MKILAIDSSAKTATAAVYDNKQLLALSVLNVTETHSESLMPTVEDLLNRCALSASGIDIFAVSCGPGSFTGVRIGVACIKGLAFGGKKCVSVSTLEALAHNFYTCDGIICPVMDARRSQVYNALFKYEGTELKRLTEDRLLTVGELFSEIERLGEKVRFCGDGYSLVIKSIESLKPNFEYIPSSQTQIWQNAASVAEIAYEKFLNGEVVTDSELKPIYLRASQAERERLEKERNQDKERG